MHWLLRHSPAGKNVSTGTEDIVAIRHQATTGENTADWGDFMCSVVTVICEVYGTAGA
jgi:hypothetical protein